MHLVSLAARHKMPAMFSRREIAEAGGLASYGASVIDAYRQTGVYVARILKGDKPGELPVMQAVKFEFVLNLKTARTLGIDVPMAFSAAADEIIEYIRDVAARFSRAQSTYRSQSRQRSRY